jgi:hypothetical protein
VKFVLLAAVIAITLALPAAARADGITATCTSSGVAEACSTGWYTSDVTVSFTLPAGSSNPQGCGNQTISSDTAGVTITCTVAVTGSQCCRLDVTIKRDATPPTVSSLAPQRGPDANGWYNHPVQVAAAGTASVSGVASCTSTTYSGPDSSSASVSGSCTSGAGLVSAPKTFSFQYDATPPSVTASPARAADANGWYNHPVGVAFTGTDAVSGVDSCSAATTYSGPDSGSASVAGSCHDKAGNNGNATIALKYDATPPTVTAATPDRAPDAGGFYNHKVVVTFAGTDSTSGIASCDAVAYDKPDSPSAKIVGQCHDNAGNASAPSPFALKYDSTPPKLTDLAAAALDGRVSLNWKPSTDVAGIVVTRRSGSSTPKTVYSGKRITTFVDKGLKNGVSYGYTVVAVDAAGNAVTVKTTAQPTARPTAPLIAPRPHAHVHGSVLLRWRTVPHAGYYNVQLWSRGAKLLSVWPSGTSYRVPHAWNYLGRAYSLAPGRYTWFVWPGRGKTTAHSFGPLLGSSSFIVTG